MYLLHVFQHFLAYDAGIESALGTGLTKRLKTLTELTSECPFTALNLPLIKYLALSTLTNISINLQGKDECVQEKVIESA